MERRFGMNINRTKFFKFVSIDMLLKPITKPKLGFSDVGVIASPQVLLRVRTLSRTSKQLINTNLAIQFIKDCQRLNVYPKFSRYRPHKKSNEFTKAYRKNQDRIINQELSDHFVKRALLMQKKNDISDQVKSEVSFLAFIRIQKQVRKECLQHTSTVSLRHASKLKKLLPPSNNLRPVPGVITNLSDYVLNNDESIDILDIVQLVNIILN